VIGASVSDKCHVTITRPNFALARHVITEDSKRLSRLTCGLPFAGPQACSLWSHDINRNVGWPSIPSAGPPLLQRRPHGPPRLVKLDSRLFSKPSVSVSAHGFYPGALRCSSAALAVTLRTNDYTGMCESAVRD
jgi:hypothetical protein